MNNWKDIWKSKSVVSIDDTENEYNIFCKLKKANGFDVAIGDENEYFRLFYKKWIDFYNMLVDIAGGSIDSIYEVGLGSGVNLFMFKNRLEYVELAGCDYSESMVQSTKKVIGKGEFKCHGAEEIEMNPKYDLVMSESVFQYFPSREFAEVVLRKMIEKSHKITYIGEIHDGDFEEELMSYRRRTIENYDEKYKGLNKLFLSKKWIEEIADDYNKKVVFTKVDNPEYLNGKYEFDCYIY